MKHGQPYPYLSAHNIFSASIIDISYIMSYLFSAIILIRNKHLMAFTNTQHKEWLLFWNVNTHLLLYEFEHISCCCCMLHIKIKEILFHKMKSLWTYTIFSVKEPFFHRSNHNLKNVKIQWSIFSNSLLCLEIFETLFSQLISFVLWQRGEVSFKSNSNISLYM